MQKGQGEEGLIILGFNVVARPSVVQMPYMYVTSQRLLSSQDRIEFAIRFGFFHLVENL